MRNNSRVYTTGEVAKVCGVTLRTVVNWIQKGKLKSYKLPGTRGDNRITSENLKHFLEENRLPYPTELLDQATDDKVVLVVEDDPNMAASIVRMLKVAGFKATIAQDGFEAGIQFEKIKPAAVTLDLNMPRLDGIQVLRHLKTLSRSNKVIVISGEGEQRLDEARRAGADAVFAKPFEPDELVKALTDLTSY